MAPVSSPSRRTPTGRRRGRPPGTTNAARAARQASLAANIASEPPPKKRRYVPGGPGGGGRFVDPSDVDTPEPSGTSTSVATAAAAATMARSRVARDVLNGESPSLMPRRERSTRTRASAADDSMQWGSTAAAVAASVKQADDYKPREERSWEEFHPHLDIDKYFVILRAEDVDNIPQEVPGTPMAQTPGTPVNGSLTPSRQINPRSTGNTPNPPLKSETSSFDATNGTPTRRSRRPTRDVVSFYGTRPSDLAASATPRTPKILPLKNQTPKERLDLKLPSYRKTNRIELFESKTFGQARYVDKAMSNVGYQESDHFIRPDRQLIKASEASLDEEIDALTTVKSDDGLPHSKIGRVEYDMDEQDDMWLEHFNAQRKNSELETITREVFEITMTKIEKEWHALEKRIPKPNPKPPQTHRPRSGSAAAVNGEPQAGEEPDSKCAICDDGDCENTNAIVFCDGCNLAVHQECYGVPFIPEGQWLCRKCQLCGRGVPTCIFCPNTDGAFKQTNSSKWSHLLCAMWIPEVSLGNHTFMEPVMDVEKVPKTRWKLNCYICNQRMGACIQCGNKNCYQAFHVTCARRARLYLKMKTSSGQLAVLDGSMVLRAFCDKHCPSDYTLEHNVRQATKSAKKFYKRNMRGRIWADSHAVANVIANQQRSAIAENGSDDLQNTAAGNAGYGDKKKGLPPKNVWRLPSGAPVIPQAVFDVVEASLQRFPFRKRKDYLSEACRYWTLKREARRGAALLKRLQLQMDAFSSMELTRRNFASMGPDGKERLNRRIQFAEKLIQDLEHLKMLTDETVRREQLKLEAAELEEEFVDECYFPIANFLVTAVEKAMSLDKELFEDGLQKLEGLVEKRFFVTTLAFAQELGDAIHAGIINPPKETQSTEHRFEASDPSPTKHTFADIRERRKLGKRILKAVQPHLETALRVECEISSKSYEILQKELETKFEASLEVQSQAAPPIEDTDAQDTIMVDTSAHAQMLELAQGSSVEPAGAGADEIDNNDAAEKNEQIDDYGADSLNISTSSGDASEDVDMADSTNPTQLPNGADASQTPPNSNDFDAGNRQAQNGPPTPPQSNGSLGKEPADPLTDGGVLWYLKPYQPHGTSVMDDEGASDDLTDLDDDVLNGLGIDVKETLEAVAMDAEAAKENITNTNKRKAASASPRKRRVSTRRR